MSPFTLENRVALVTGSSTGLGKETAACLGRAGAKVALNYANNKERAESALAEFHAIGITAELFPANITNAEEIDAMVTAIEQSLGPIDIAVMNATPAQPLKPIEEYDWDFYQQMLDFFIKSPYLLARRLLPGMKERKRGRLINITSETFYWVSRHFQHTLQPKVARQGGHAAWQTNSLPMASQSIWLLPDGYQQSVIKMTQRKIRKHTLKQFPWADGVNLTMLVGLSPILPVMKLRL